MPVRRPRRCGGSPQLPALAGSSASPGSRHNRYRDSKRTNPAELNQSPPDSFVDETGITAGIGGVPLERQNSTQPKRFAQVVQ